MARRRSETQRQVEPEGFRTVTCAENWEQAEEYESWLKINRIPAQLKPQGDSSLSGIGIAVMVPHALWEQARIVIQFQDDYDDLDDPVALDDEDDDDNLFELPYEFPL